MRIAELSESVQTTAHPIPLAPLSLKIEVVLPLPMAGLSWQSPRASQSLEWNGSSGPWTSIEDIEGSREEFNLLFCFNILNSNICSYSCRDLLQLFEEGYQEVAEIAQGVGHAISIDQAISV
jgi:hypothetical protein